MTRSRDPIRPKRSSRRQLLGRGDYAVGEWASALALARERWTEHAAEYLIGTPLLADYLTEGLDQLDAAPA